MTKERDILEMDQAADQFDEQQDNYKYTAFISYRHLEPDATIAKKIHTMIETFKAPKEFYDDGKKPTFRVFRDREELTTSSLSDSIQDALRSSQYLIVICSKRLRESEWCNIEVETFMRLHGAHRIIPVLIEGEPEDSFPKALLGDGEDAELEHGNVDVGNTDILAAELRSEEAKDPNFVGFETLEKNYPEQLKALTNKAIHELKTEKYRIMAAILGVSYGDLKQRDKARRQRAMLTLSGIVSFALLFFGIFMYNAYKNENIAKRQTIQDRSAFLLDDATLLEEEGDRLQAIAIANQALNDVDEDMDTYNTLKARHVRLLNQTVNQGFATYDRILHTGNRYTFLDVDTTRGRFATGLDNTSIALWDTQTGNQLKTAQGHTQQVKLVYYSNENTQLVSGGFDDRIVLWDAETLEKKQEMTTPGNVMLIQWSNDDASLHVIYDTIDDYVYQRYNATTLEAEGPALVLRPAIKRVIFDDADIIMWVVYQTYQENASLVKYDLTTGTELKTMADPVKESTTDPSAEEPDTEDTENLLGTGSFTMPFDDAVRSQKENAFYAFAGSRLMKISLDDDSIRFTSGDEFYTHQEALHLTEMGDAIYVADSTHLKKLDAKTGDVLWSMMPGDGAVQDIAASEATNVVLLLMEDGSIVVIQNDRVVDELPNRDDSRPEYLFFKEDGTRALVLSLTDQTIKTMHLEEQSSVTWEDGQFVGISRNQQYALIYRDNRYDLVNTETGAVEREITSTMMKHDVQYIMDTSSYILSDDGLMLAGLDTLLDDEGSVISARVFVMNTQTEEVLFTIPAPMAAFHYGFAQDGSLLYLTTANDTVTFYDAKNGMEWKALTVEKGFVQNLVLSEDNRYLAVNYTEGVSHVYNVGDAALEGTVPGTTIYLAAQEEGLFVAAIYNNIASKYMNFEKQADIVLAKERDGLGAHLREMNRYDEEHDLLLTIKSLDSDHYAYLIDFSTGNLIQSFVMNNTAYAPKGLIQDGTEVWMDHSFGLIENADESFDGYSRIIRYPIRAYEELLEESEQAIEGIEFIDTPGGAHGQ